MTTIHTILKTLAERARILSVDTAYHEGYRKGYFHALDEVSVEIEKAVVSDSEWLSPNDEERAMQVSKLKSLFPSFPKGGVKWQYMNGLLEMAWHIMDDKWILKRAEEITRRELKQNLIQGGFTVEPDDE